MKNSFFRELDLNLKEKGNHSNLILNCLLVIAHQMNLPINLQIDDINGLNIDNFQDYQDALGIALYPVSITSIYEMSKSIHPILFQTKDNNHFYVLLRKKRGEFFLYDPLKNIFVPFLISKNIQHNIIYKAWQCCSIGFSLPSTSRELLKSIIPYFKRSLFLTVLMGIVVSSMTLFPSFVSGYVFSHLYEMRGLKNSSIFIAFFMFFISISFFSYLNELSIKSINVKILYAILPSLWNRIFNLPMRTLNKFSSGELTQLLFNYETAISAILLSNLSILFGGMTLLLLFGYMIYCSGWIAFFYFSVCIVISIIKLFFLPKNVKYITHQLAEQNKLCQFLNETLLQINKIRSANVENTIFKKWLSHLISVKMLAEKSTKIEILVWALESIIPVGLLLSFYSTLYFFSHQTNTYFLLQFMICASQFSSLFDKLSLDILTVVHAFPSLNSIEPIASTVTEKIAKVEKNDNKKINFTLKGDLSFSRVFLRDEKTGKWILDDISFHIREGEFVAFVGESGAGKSTVFKLLLGFEAISAGAILRDKENIDHFNISDIRKQIGVVLQTSNLLPGTILSNLSANKNLTHDEAWQLARYVGLDEEINAMPMKMHTYLSDNASESISGGQKQKILIARALATRPRLLLLDEATSALDNR